MCLKIAYREALGESVHHTHCLITDEDAVWEREREREMVVSLLSQRALDMSNDGYIFNLIQLCISIKHKK